MAWGAAIAGVAGALGSILGGTQAQQASAKQARLNRQFQERMSSTAHQREIADLKLAGLNPILSGLGGKGASTPPGAMAQQQEFGSKAVSSALAALRLKEEIKNITSQRGLVDSQKDKVDAETKTILAKYPLEDLKGDTVLSLRSIIDPSQYNIAPQAEIYKQKMLKNYPDTMLKTKKKNSPVTHEKIKTIRNRANDKYKKPRAKSEYKNN